MAVYKESFGQMEARINLWSAESGLQITLQGKEQNRACWSAGNRLLCLTNLDKNVVRLEWWDYSYSSPDNEAREAMKTLSNIIGGLKEADELNQISWPGESDHIVQQSINAMDNGVAFDGEMGNIQFDAEGKLFIDYIPPTVVYDKEKYERWERRRMTTQTEAVKEFLLGFRERGAEKSGYESVPQERSSDWRRARYTLFQKLRIKHPEMTYRKIADIATETIYDEIEDQLRSQNPGIRGDKLESEKQKIFREFHNPGRNVFSEDDVKNDFRKFGKHSF